LLSKAPDEPVVPQHRQRVVAEPALVLRLVDLPHVVEAEQHFGSPARAESNHRCGVIVGTMLVLPLPSEFVSTRYHVYPMVSTYPLVCRRIASRKSSILRFKHLFSSNAVLVSPPRPHLRFFLKRIGE